MAKLILKNRLGASAGRRRKAISFDSNRDQVHPVRVPPRTQNAEYWFSERQKMVKKGLNFEIEPDISVEVNVDSKLQIGAIAYPAVPSTSSSARVFLEVKELQMSLFGGDGSDEHWLCVGSVAPGGLQKVKLILPPGMYQLRCVGGKSPVQLFGQAWDVERELF